MKTALFGALALTLALVNGPKPAQAQAGAGFSDIDELNLAYLQSSYSSGVAAKVPWAGYWWPYRGNGIATGRYNSSGIAPTTKLDRIYRTGGEASRWETSHHGTRRNGGSAGWWGHCNGWAAASIMNPEPRSMIDRDGYNFTVADQKALLTEYWMQSDSDFIGTRVEEGEGTADPSFWDVSPAQFHLTLTNVLGREHRSFVVDRYTGAQVWNQPLVAYQVAPIRSSDYLGPDPKRRSIYRINVTTTIWWVNDLIGPNTLTPNFRWQTSAHFQKRTLRYELWLDAPPKFDARGRLVSSGEIILTELGNGGRWKNGTSLAVLNNSHPDFMWIPMEAVSSTGRKNPSIHDEWIEDNISRIAN